MLHTSSLGNPTITNSGVVDSWAVSATSSAAPTPRTTPQRLPDRVTHDREAAYAILDEALVAHVGFSTDEGPVVIPTLQVRDGDRLLMHGSVASRFIRTATSGIPLCVTVTLIDGVILGRAAFHHSAAFRSVVIFGEATKIEDLDERTAALERFVNGIVPGRLTSPYPPRRPADKEVRTAMLLSLPIEEFSVKVRSGFARDEAKDDAVEAWAGVIPLRLTSATPMPDPITGTRFPVPDYATAYVKTRPAPKD